ncbi:MULTISPECIES: hypothetical protein [unclassified Sphingomonas]|uniref:hypothetical protein n=1 Tax=unclassified Sphingomonas TaxID=196159 RepID=UPI00226AE2C4|nr:MULTISPECIES: hypothetical protein [unclassified Sphingomonas]
MRMVPDSADWDLTVAAGWKTLLGRLINDGARLRFFPHRIMMFLLLAQSDDGRTRDLRLDDAEKTLVEWKRIARGMTTHHADIGVAEDLSPKLTAFMMPKRDTFDVCVDRFGETATRLVKAMRQGGGDRALLSDLADYVATELLACMNQLVADFAKELEITSEGERDASLSTRRNVAWLESSAATVARLTDDLARVNAGVRMIALNAQIEAARSDTHGQAFGAVAAEIKALCGRIGKLTADIQAHLQKG